MSRPRRARSIWWATKSSPCSSAAMAARWMKLATPEVEYWTRFSITWPSAAGHSSQPMRQPVIAQFFEKVWTNRMRSSVVHDVVERGRARVRAVVDEAAIDLVGDDPEPVPAREIEDGVRVPRGVAVQPVGLAGELTKIARVRGVTARASRSMSSVPAALGRSSVIGTSTGVAPDDADARRRNSARPASGPAPRRRRPRSSRIADLQRVHAADR